MPTADHTLGFSRPSSTAPQDTGPDSYGGPAADRRRRRRLLLAAVLAVVLAAGGTLYYVAHRVTAPILGTGCTAVAGGRTVDAGLRPGRQRGDDHRRRRPPQPARAGRHHRDRHRPAGVQAAQPGVRRPGLGRPVPAAALAGLGDQGAGDRPGVRRQRVLRRARQDRGLPRRCRSPRPRRRCSAARSPRRTPRTRPTRGCSRPPCPATPPRRSPACWARPAAPRSSPGRPASPRGPRPWPRRRSASSGPPSPRAAPRARRWSCTCGPGTATSGWAVAQWAVARADKLSVVAVSTAGRAWSRTDNPNRWTAQGVAGLAPGHVVVQVS